MDQDFEHSILKTGFLLMMLLFFYAVFFTNESYGIQKQYKAGTETVVQAPFEITIQRVEAITATKVIRNGLMSQRGRSRLRRIVLILLIWIAVGWWRCTLASFCRRFCAEKYAWTDIYRNPKRRGPPAKTIYNYI